MDRTILVIDDDVAIHKMLSEHLANAHTEVQLACSGESGLALARHCKPDLILLDVDMPGMNGHEVCRQLKFDLQTQGIPIMFLTAAGTVPERIQGLDQGAVDYVLKPFDPFEVAARVRAAFRAKTMVEAVEAGTMLDTLTSTGSRRAFENHLQAELARAHRSSESIACILLELDHFNQLIRDDGQSETDAILCRIANILKEICRTEDRIFRYSDRQFAVIAPNLGPVDIMTVGDRLRESIQSHPAIRHREGCRLTVSVGMAISKFSFGRSVVDEAAEALAQARDKGGDTIIAGGEHTQLRMAV